MNIKHTYTTISNHFEITTAFKVDRIYDFVFILKKVHSSKESYYWIQTIFHEFKEFCPFCKKGESKTMENINQSNIGLPCRYFEKEASYLIPIEKMEDKIRLKLVTELNISTKEIRESLIKSRKRFTL